MKSSKRTNGILAMAAALAIGGVPLMAADQAEPVGATPSVVDKTQEAVKDATGAVADTARGVANDMSSTTQPALRGQTSPDAKEIRRDLARIVDAALSKNGVEDVIEWTTKADRQRIGEASEVKDENLNARLEQFNNDWKAKYGDDFRLKSNEEMALNNVQILQGDLGDSARTASGTLPPGGSNRADYMSKQMDNSKHDMGDMKHDATNQPKAGDSPRTASDTLPPGGSNRADDMSKQMDNTKRDMGDMKHDATNQPKAKDNAVAANTADENRVNKNMATVVVPAAGDMPAVTLRFSNEGTMMDAWRLTLPDNLTAQQLRDNISRAVQQCQDMKAQWPADKTEAYRAVSHRILAAIANQNSSSDQPSGK